MSSVLTEKELQAVRRLHESGMLDSDDPPDAVWAYDELIATLVHFMNKCDDLEEEIRNITRAR